MAERSFTKEVRQLRVPAGTEFRGEGILAVTKALLESGVSYVTGYQGSPISHLMDVLADAQPILNELGVYFEPAANEAAAAAALSASVNYPVRGAVTWKSTVGTNVASDALANLASGGVTGGALIIVGEDYGEGSSIMQERTHAFAMKSQMWLLDPKPNLPAIVQAVHDGFALSEATNTPVMLELRIRSCHLHGSFVTRENKRPGFTLKDALENPTRDVNRIVLPPASFLHEKEKLEQRWPAAVKFIQERQLNEFVEGDLDHIGVISLGGLSNNVLRALKNLDQADLFGNTRVPIYILNVAYPLVEAEVIRFCEGKRAVLMIEEGQPDYLEQNLNAILRRHGLDAAVHGKDLLPPGGDYTVAVLQKGIRGFLEQHHRAAFAKPVTIAMPTVSSRKATVLDGVDQAPVDASASAALALTPLLPPRPPGLCVGCPERPIFSSLKLLEREIGMHHVSADIGCHLFSIMPPFNLGATTMGYGLGGSSASAFAAGAQLGASKRAIAFMGDGGFWHNGLTSGIANAVFNKQGNVFVIVDNNYSAATGGQDIPSSRAINPHRSTMHAIERAVRGVGVDWVRTLANTYDVNGMRAALKEALSTDAPGPKVIVAQSECMLNRQRREKPAKAKAIKAGERVLKERFGVDAAVCSGDHACMRVSGCPSLTLAPSGDALKPDPVANVDEHCVACGHCGEVADAAVLCPSFYKATKVNNPGRVERWRDRLRQATVGWLQGRQWRSRAERALFPMEALK
ncbi:indolepyruvate ferredoxin oxidoreductase alpha subunit [Variovorax boronicumulans]|uniref:Indolepyruvate ferredoxin oxidoreductase alpha subunit n=1 Tax=Variovorax boronicumulans TaxID=436515 RepID=A0AAW8D3A6_9BURK|nr:indolepyruvate ferredoxin oxidoreductase subunit alpha [Variovorax boronicumulans]MDP9896872.1 indolepyruvate ferredoxin oxidoreductase alpha subunit [Variovorax boronicumulans]MDP9993960.1 indolepyruvate ferredoxin oxidoreductase alpha subunit [Variovorax boronicumulans]MDQ0005177.1 indolepyruvate ferredoxin oxidoreductase alpha subunit [Variovorax boronicumulans]MDQ0044711.1 indolepyruvate ferredoxin oxidoreductase alpha subunit [Variovorax boronicumulans]MDQ0056804.1 indolepyruvate ferre